MFSWKIYPSIPHVKLASNCVDPNIQKADHLGMTEKVDNVPIEGEGGLSHGSTEYIRILTPTGSHFEVNAAALLTVHDLKALIFETWPKGIKIGLKF